MNAIADLQAAQAGSGGRSLMQRNSATTASKISSLRDHGVENKQPGHAFIFSSAVKAAALH